MKKPALRSLFFFLLGGVLFAALSAFFYWKSVRQNVSQLAERLGAEISADFNQKLETIRQNSTRLASHIAPEADLNAEDGGIRMLVDSIGRIRRWSSSEFIPPPRILDELSQTADFNTCRHNNKTWYFFRTPAATGTLITFIPLEVNYNIENSNLPPFLFLGRYNAFPRINAQVRDMSLHLRETKSGILVKNPKGQLIFCIQANDPRVFTWPERAKSLWLALFATLMLLVALWKYLQRMKTLHAALVFSVAVVGVRAMAIWLGLPNQYLPVKMFSSSILAINSLTPSLGDLLLNVAVLVTVTLVMVRAWMLTADGPDAPRWQQKISERIKINPGGTLPTLFGLLSAAGVAVLLREFLVLFSSILQNSRINFEYSNIFELDKYSLLGFAAIAGLLLTLQALTFLLLRGQTRILGRGEKFSVIFSFIFGALIFFLVSGMDLAGTLGFGALYLGSYLVSARTSGLTQVRLDLVNFLLVTLVFSLLTTLPVIRGELRRDAEEMELIASRLGDDHNLITESLFQRTVRKIEDEAYVLESGYSDETMPMDIGLKLKEQYFEPSFKGYEVRVFVYDENLNRLDRSTGADPYLRPDSEIKPNQVGSPTLTPNLYLVPYQQSISGSIYMGQFDLLLRGTGKVQVVVELHPNEVQPNRLYPQLLLDDKVRNKSSIDQRFEYAVYRNGKLFRKRSEEPFPLFSNFAPQQGENKSNITRQNGNQQLITPVNAQKTVVVRVPGYGWFSTANLFSFVFYFYVLGFLVCIIPYWLFRWVRERGSFFRFTLRARIQVFLLVVSVVPLFTVLFLLSPYIRKHIYQDLSANLQESTERIASLLENDYLLLRQPGIGTPAVQRKLRNKLSEYEKTIFNDINIFKANGTLHFTTQPAIYELGLTSEYMDPVVYEKFITGQTSDLVTEDHIGNVSFFSGYCPLQTTDGKVVGFLNIPSLKNQEQVNAQSLNLLTFLVDLYVFLFLAVGIIAVIVSDSITRPLTLLGSKLKATSLGGANEPIKWDTHDEIGDIISAYNQMLEKLAESEQKLARKERELAWKEMARQVAHEIKNPLTPMKLSIQHLVRAWRENSPNKEKVFEKVTNTILVQIDSLVHIANSFSEFARMPEPQKSLFNLSQVIQEVAELYTHNQEQVQIELHLPEREFFVNSDREQLSRVFNNLIKNGIQAIEHGAGLIQVRMEIRGRTARIEIEDNGKGITDEIREKIFEPNFSTKTSGMGLGLAIVKRILESAGGSISFESKAGEGTTFHIELPEADPPAENQGE